MFKCPVPKCDHMISDVLTNNHCETAHGMSKQQMLKEFGELKLLKVDNNALKQNLAMMQCVTLNQFRA